MDVDYIAKLANLTLQAGEEEKYGQQFVETLSVVNVLSELETSQILPTNQVTGLKNVTRPDEIDSYRQLSQSDSLSGAKLTRAGYFVVPRLVDDAKPS